ncbi:MAG: tRNA (adenosine(37)-N6)-threonylcarbamoyltransferase complex ATPase subunit type 1 TsaE [Erythrobacter sp.]
MSHREKLPDLPAMTGFGGRIAGQLRAGDVVALSGGLGTGKTTLSRAILTALGHEGDVPSPTFTIIECYDAPQMRLPIVHADFYRLDNPDEVQELGLDDYRDGAALLAEWPQNAGGFAHEPTCLSIALEVADEGRVAIVEAGPDWVERLP